MDNDSGRRIAHHRGSSASYALVTELVRKIAG